MKYATFDVETTITNKGNPFDHTNKLVCGGLLYGGDKQPVIDYNYTQDRIDKLNDVFNSYMIVGVNLKFDLNWARRLGCSYPKRIWDCQLAHFLITHQKDSYPSLDDMLEMYGFPPKYDKVKKDYWDNGIDTDQVPKEILTEYLATDLIRTEQVFKHQYQLFQTEEYRHLYKLFCIQCHDLLVLADMEWNGVKFNTEKALAKAEEIHAEQEQILQFLRAFFNYLPFSLTSDVHLSTLLYGGVFLEEVRVPIGLYKTGAKKGQVRYKVEYVTYDCPRLAEPLKGTEVRDKVSKKEQDYIDKGVLKEPRKFWSVNEETLRQLRVRGEGKKAVAAIMRFNKLEKLRSTYLIGWSKLIDTMHWEKDMIHSQLNQCLAVTGRLSSSKPNGQNADKLTKLFCESRYA